MAADQSAGTSSSDFLAASKTGVVPSANAVAMVFTHRLARLVIKVQNNSGKDFYGKGNLVRQGGKFYLVGKLELGSKLIGTETGTAWPTTYAIPPYTATGASQEITRVFIQDYLTTATFKIGTESLQNAFITVPDLRSTQTSLGLSVDLNWRKGLNFDNVSL